MFSHGQAEEQTKNNSNFVLPPARALFARKIANVSVLYTVFNNCYYSSFLFKPILSIFHQEDANMQAFWCILGSARRWKVWHRWTAKPDTVVHTLRQHSGTRGRKCSPVRRVRISTQLSGHFDRISTPRKGWLVGHLGTDPWHFWFILTKGKKNWQRYANFK